MASIADLYHDSSCCTEPHIPMALLRSAPFLALGYWKPKEFVLAARGWFLLRCLPQISISRSVRHIELHCAYAVLIASIKPLWKKETWAYWGTIKSIVWIGLIRQEMSSPVKTIWEHGALADEQSGQE